jgi:lipopolysaccharide transport system permease protein
LAGVIEGFRWALTGQGNTPSLLLAASNGIVILLLSGGLIYFQSTEATVADVV